MKKLIPFTLLLATACAAYGVTLHQDRQAAEAVRNGTVTLVCQFRDGTRAVDPAKVKSFTDGRWYFHAGSAASCEVVK